MTFSSWTYDQKGIDYLPYSDSVGISNFLENEEWYLLHTTSNYFLNIYRFAEMLELNL